MDVPQCVVTESTPFTPGRSARVPVWRLCMGAAAVVLLFTVACRSPQGVEAAESLNVWQSLRRTFGDITAEIPSYRVVDSFGDVEIRFYDSGVAIETDAPNANNAESFRRLASYLGVFGNPANKKLQPIAMTAPVVTQQGKGPAASSPFSSGEKKGSMQFLLPSQYQSVKDAPRPTNAKVRVVKLPSRLVAVQKFNGETSEEDTNRRAKALSEAVQREGYRVVSGAQLARYNDRSCLPLLRRNEVQLRVENPNDY